MGRRVGNSLLVVGLGLLVCSVPVAAQPLPTPDAPGAHEQAWARRLAAQLGLGAPARVTRVRRAAGDHVGRGVRVELDGVVVERLDFRAPEAAARYVAARGGEARGQRVVAVGGRRLQDAAFAARARAAAWGEPPLAFEVSAAPAPTREGPPPPVVVIGVDPASLVRLGPWGPAWRAHHARLLDRLSAAGVRGVAFDMDFAERPGHEAATAALARAIAASRAPVVVTRHDEVGPDLSVQTSDNAPEIARVVAGEATVLTWRPLVIEGGREGAAREIERARRAGRSPGFPAGAHAFDADVGGRRGLVETLAVRSGDLRPGDLERLGLVKPAPVGVGHDAQGQVVIFTEDVVLVPTAAPSSVTTLSYVDVLEGRVEPSVLRGALVFVGMNDGVEDVHEVPGRGRMSGVFFHAFLARAALSAAHEAWKAGRLRDDDPERELEGLLERLEGVTAAGAAGR